MTATIMPPEMVEAFKPEYVAPLVGYLAHSSNEETGSIFEVGSGWIAKVRWQRTGGVGFPTNRPLLPEQIAEAWPRITDFEDGRATNPETTQESFQAVMENFSNVAEEEEKKPEGTVDIEAAKKIKFDTTTFEYGEREVILYALGVGCKRTDLKYVYENDTEFSTLPTFGVIPSFSIMSSLPFGDILPNFNPVSVYPSTGKHIYSTLQFSGR